MLESIIFLPLLAGLITLFLPVQAGRIMLASTGLLHLVLTCVCWLVPLDPLWPAIFTLTAVGILVLLVTSFIFVFIALYGVFYMKEQEMQSESIFIGCMLIFLGTMSMVALADNPIVLWIAIEATTLSSAPLIFINRSPKAMEATWKYVLICSVGIALALLGFFFLIVSLEKAGLDIPLTFTSLNSVALQLDPLWLKIGYIFVLIGLGTKMGLAPMHTWLPDAHSEAPSPASALLSGALLNCAFIGIYKTHTLMYLAGQGAFSSSLLIGFGLFSIFIAGIFILHQPDYKRMLAYSSVENMGIIAFGIGVGGVGLYGAMLHLIQHSLLKSSLFLTAGNVVLGFGSKLIAHTGNMVGVLPRTFVLFFGGIVGIVGLPPFGVFISEMMIIMGALQRGHSVATVLFIAGVVLVIAGLAKNSIAMSFAPYKDDVLVPEQLPRLLPPLALLVTSIVLSFWIPECVLREISAAIAVLGGVIHG